jgi:hypothetical protein
MTWNIRLANPEDAEVISQLAIPFRDKVSPYVLNPTQIKAYIDEWLVAEQEECDSNGASIPGQPIGLVIGGALHFVAKKSARNLAYLYHMKQVYPDIIEWWSSTEAVFMSQPTCPGKGSLRALVDYLKQAYKPLWAWLSIVSPVIKFYEDQLGFVFEEKEYKFLNVYKGDYSTFRVGIWTPK